MTEQFRIREASGSDLADVLRVTKAAFGQDIEADLVNDLLNDPSARPVLSLLAFKGEQAVGHILFTAARLTGARDTTIPAILAPLSVVPDAQGQGVGGRLIEAGAQRLSQSGVDLIFVLGHPDYYPRHGFAPAGTLGFEAPYPILDKNADAWMVRALSPGVIGSVEGMVMCADAMSNPDYWRE